MANPWFRMYAEFATDAKVQSMSEAMQRRLTMLLCLRCSDVTVTLSDEELAFQLRITDEELAETKALFLRKGFIEESWEISNWDKRQFVSDSSAARVAKHRAAKKEGQQAEPKEVDAACNVTVTPQNRTDTEQNRTEEMPPAAKSTKPSKKNKTPLPADFAVSERVEKWAKEKGYGQLEAHLENFLSACRKSGYVYVDWDEAFMDAIRKDWAKLRTVGYQPGAPPAPPPKPIRPVEEQVPALAPMQRSGRPANFDSIKQGLKARETP